MARDTQLDQPNAQVEEKPGRGLFGSLKFYGGIGALGLLGVFFVQNTEEASVDLLFWSFDMPLFVALAIAAGIGAVAGWLFAGFRDRARRRARRNN